ncbi:Alpha/Beta hydrolase protein [Russula vinacea]|nr:Alpha/Beta hydrolase protein [Russula vinacea]
MLFRSVLVSAFALSAALVSSNQFPRVNGASSSDTSTPTPGKLRVVENSGVCETTPGVYQASGYGDLASDKSIWFWFFAARKNPDTAPLITWFNGGPGDSSMIGLFQELGPCRISNDSTRVDINPTSWNELFIDQPVGVGFSYGTGSVNTTEQAAADVWAFLQIWFADPRFQKYASRDFGIWTESYGGHYGPIFATHFMQQNVAIQNGTVKGVTIKLNVLGIGNGFTDPLTQFPGNIQYAQSNPYHPLANSSIIAAANTSWSQADVLKRTFCTGGIFLQLTGNWDANYVPTEFPDPYPPALDPYLNNSAVTSKIGSQHTWLSENTNVFDHFTSAAVIDAGVRTVLYNGDADYICNYIGSEAMIDSLNTTLSSLHAKQDFANYTVNGALAGLYKNAGMFSYLRIFGAGHQAAAYMWKGVPRGAAALQMFTQIMSNQSLSST